MDYKDLEADIRVLLEKAACNAELGRPKRAAAELHKAIALIDEFKKQEKENANQN